MKWLGLEWDGEGSINSRAPAVIAEVAEQMLAKGRPITATPRAQELDEMRELSAQGRPAAAL